MDKKKYRILQIHNYYQIPGGEDTVVSNEKKLLESHDHTVIQYTRTNSELKTFSKIRKLMLPFTTIFNPKTYRDVKRIIKGQHIDIVHVHNTLNLISPAVYYAALRCNVPVVQTIHNFRLLCPGATFYRDGHICEDCVKNGLWCALKHKCYRGSRIQTLICVISTYIHRMLRIYGKINYICLTEFNNEKLLQIKQINPSMTFVKPNFIDMSNNITIPYEQREDRFIFAGRLNKLKGITLLFKTWKLLGENAPKLIVCGTGEMENLCKRYIRENQLDSIEMRGFISNDEVKKLIANSKALVLPTQWYEGFPMTILEAYGVGTPVIGSNIGNVNDLIKAGINGEIFDASNSIELANAVREVMRRNEYGIKYRFEDSRELYSPRRNIEILEDIYKQCFKQ